VNVFGNSVSKVDHPSRFSNAIYHSGPDFENLLPLNLSSGVAASDAAERMLLQQRASILVAEKSSPSVARLAYLAYARLTNFSSGHRLPTNGHRFLDC
jgi:hypothetical protein